MNEVPLVLSSPTLVGFVSWCDAKNMREVHIPVPLVTDLQDTAAMGLDVLPSVCLSNE